MKYIKLTILPIVLFLDLYIFKGPLFSIMGLLLFFVKIFYFLIKKRSNKENILYFILFLILYLSVDFIGEQINVKIKEFATNAYNQKINNITNEKIEYYVFNSYVYLYKEGNELKIFANLYNFKSAKFINNKWEEIESFEN